jgi:hypothetical protein
MCAVWVLPLRRTRRQFSMPDGRPAIADDMMLI